MHRMMARSEVFTHDVLLNITGGPDMTLFEIDEASSMIQQEAHEEANIIFGTVVDETMTDEIRITVIATGFEDTIGRKAIGKIASMGGYKRADLATPTFMRNEKAEGLNVVKMGLIDDEANPDLEIPTFLRRQAD
jgi:cell division protein FtsZ